MKTRPLFKRSLLLLAAPLTVPFAVMSVGVGFAAPLHIDADPHLTIPTPAPRPNPNGFDMYVAAAKAIIPAVPPVDPVNDPNGTQLTPAQQAQNYSLDRKRAWLTTNKHAFALFQKAMQTPSMTPNERDSDMPTFAAYARLRELARCKAIEANAAKMAKQPAQAVRSSLDTIQMGMDIRRGGGLIAELVGIAIAAIGRSDIEDFDVTINALNAREAGEAAKRLEGLLAHQPTIAQAMQEGRWQTLAQLQRVFKTTDWRKVQSEWNFQQVVQSKTVSKTQIAQRINQSFDEAIETLRQPYRPYDPSAKPQRPLADPFSEMFRAPEPNRSVMNEARNNVGLKLLLLRLALRAYYAEKGSYPVALSKLTPRYLKGIPTDDFNANKPFFYRLKGKSYELWSVGPDGKNDNGIPIPPRLSAGTKQTRPASVMPDSIGDYVAGKNR